MRQNSSANIDFHNNYENIFSIKLFFGYNSNQSTFSYQTNQIEVKFTLIIKKSVVYNRFYGIVLSKLLVFIESYLDFNNTSVLIII